MSKTQILGLATFTLSHIFLILNFVFDSSTGDFVYLFYIAWGFGIISVISNIILADKIGIKTWILVVFATSGIFWFFPPLLITFFGFPFLFIFFVIAVYIQTKGIMSER